MYTKDGRTISLEEAQEALEFTGMESLENWANEFGWAEEGKQAVPEAATPPTEPEKKKKNNTAAGDSSSADTSLESPETEPFVPVSELEKQKIFEGFEQTVNNTSIEELREQFGIDDDWLDDELYFNPNLNVEEWVRAYALQSTKRHWEKNYERQKEKYEYAVSLQEWEEESTPNIRYAVIDGEEINELYYNKHVAGTKGPGNTTYPKTLDSYVRGLNWRRKKGEKYQILEREVDYRKVPKEVIENTPRGIPTLAEDINENTEGNFPIMLEEVDILQHAYDRNATGWDGDRDFNITKAAIELQEVTTDVTPQDAKLTIALLDLGYVEASSDISRYLSKEDAERFYAAEDAGEKFYVPAYYQEQIYDQPWISENPRADNVAPPTIWDLNKENHEISLFYDIINNAGGTPFRNGPGAFSGEGIDYRDLQLLTKSQILDGYDIGWAPDEVVAEGVNTDKNRNAQIYLGDLRTEERSMLTKYVLNQLEGELGDEYRRVLQDSRVSPSTGPFGYTPQPRTMMQHAERITRYNRVLNKEEYDELLKDEGKRIELELNVFSEASSNLETKWATWEANNAAILKKKTEYETLIQRRKEAMGVAPLRPKSFLGSAADRYNEKVDAYNKNIEDLNALIEEYTAFMESDEVQSLADQSQALVGETQKLVAEEKDLLKRIEQANDAAVLFDAFGKNYNIFSKLALSLEETFIGSTAAIFEVMAGSFDKDSDEYKSMTENELAKVGWIYDAMEAAETNLADYRHTLEARRGNIAQVRTYDEAKEDGKVGWWFVDTVFNAVPTLAAIFIPQARASGLARKSISRSAKNMTKAEKAVEMQKYMKVARRQTMLTFAVMEGGGYAQQTLGGIERAAERNKEIAKELEELRANENADNVFFQNKIKELEAEYEHNEGLLDMDTLDISFGMAMNASIATAAEGLGTLRTLDRIQRGSRAIGFNALRKYIKEPIAKWASNVIGSVKQMVVGVPIEIAEEVVTKVGQNVLEDEMVGGVHVTEGIDAEFIRQTAVSSFVINAKAAGPRVINSIRNTFATRSEIRGIREIVGKVSILSEKIENLSKQESTPENLEQMRKMQQEKDLLLKNLLREDINILTKLENLTDQDLIDIARADMRIRDLQEEAGNLMDGNVRNDEINKELQSIQEQIDRQVQIREGLLNKTEVEIEELSNEAQNKAEAKLQLQQLNYSRAFAKATMGKNYFEINSIEELKDQGFSEKELAKIESNMKRGDNAYYNEGKTILFLQNTKAIITAYGGIRGMMAATSPMHEFGHMQIEKAGIVTDEGLVGIGDGMVQNVIQQIENAFESKRISEKMYNAIMKRINKYKELNKGQHNAEELITLIVDLKGNNILNDSGFKQIWQIKSFINGVIKRANPKAAPFFKLDSYADVVNFVEHTVDKFKSGKQITRQLPPEDESSIQGRASIALLDEINALVPESIETQEQFFDRKVFNPIYNDGNLHPAITNYIRSRSVSQEEANKIIESVADRLVNFNPAATRKSGDARITFGEFLFSNVNFGKLDARKALFEESQERARLESTDSEQARQITAAETTTTSQQEMPEYKNLVERKVLSEEGFAAVGKIVQRTARTLKTRMDQAVSKNVTIKPYIAEIKKTIGKQADIIFKKEMGGLKDGELRKYLLKNKRAILENMTTTYLMTAMPNAVQKKVNGAWTSDWQGKKIDRETVSTDNAGRTSGAEMVRRLPNASTRLSDADFLSNFFTEDGKLIRGRKESLAKAMAEETAFDILNQELLDPNSDIREAFEQRQEELSAVLLDNFVANVRRDVERGNAKASIGFDITDDADVKRFKNLVKEVDKYGIDSVVDTKGNLLPGYDEEYGDLEGIGELVRLAHEAGAIIDPDGLKYMQRVQRSELIPADIKKFLAENKSLGKRSDKARLDRFDRERLVIAEALGGNILAALDPSKKKTGNEVSILGSHYRVLDPAQKKKDGSKGAYRDSHVKMLASPNKPLPDGLVLEDVVLFNSSFGLMAEIHAILNSNMLASQKLEELKQYEDKIRKANVANIKLYKHIATTIRDLYKSGQISGETVVELFQMQADLAAGFRALSSFSYITVTDGPLGKAKGEHLGDNATTSFKIMERMFDDFMTDAEFQAKMDLDLRTHDQWLANATVTKAVDAYGVNNPSADMRIKFTGKRVNDVFTFDGKPASKVIDARMESLKQYEAFINGLDFAELDQAKQDISDVESSGKASIGVPRAVFMVGGPGAGKTNVGKGLKLGRRGFKVINQDIALEPMKEQAGLPANEQQYNKEQRSMRAKLGAAARKAAEQKMSQYMEGKKSMVVDGTGASYNATMKKINALREAGYEVSIVFANTSKEEAVARNKARAERALPDMIVERTWDAVQESAKLYKEEFGDRFYELNTNELKMGQDLPAEFLNKLYNDLDVPVGKASIQVDVEFNEIIERRTGVGAEKTYSRIQAQIRGRNKGRFKFFIAPGADDFRGLVHYSFAGKGKQGEADMAWLEEKLMIPYFKGIAAIDAMRQQIKRDFAVVKKQFRPQYKMLSKKIGDSQFTYDHALRVFMWDRQGIEVEGLAKRDKKLLLDAIAQNKELVELADALLVVGRRDEWPEPAEYWEAGSVLSDLNGMTEKVGRKKFLEEFIANAEIIFSEKNLNKIEALYGRRHREALEDSLYAMKNGTNRPTGSNRQVNAWLNWINGSTGAIMFFNRRSALLQMLSFTNFINWSDNNILKAGAAFANQKQYWKDWAMIFNSDKLKERRGGLKQDVSDSEIAAIAGKSKNSPQAILAYLLKIGFTPTQIADSMAIATGGATFYRNRVNRYLKQGMSQKEAEEQAWLDFSMKSDEAQQSSDPALVSQQQRSVLGRLVLAFANTPMQYTRLMKKAGQDLINGRGSAVENISKIAYYGAIQNFVFSALQSALFAMAFDDDDEDEELSEAEVERKMAKEEQRTIRVANSMLDTVLRGSGVYGAVASTMKNTIMEYYKQEEKGFLADHTYTLLAAAGISPPIQSKFRKIYSAIQTKRFEKDNVEARGWAITADGRLNLGPNWSILGNVLSGVTNVPLDRVVDEMKSISEALDERNQAWQRIALALGWKTWDVGVRNEEADLIKSEAKEARKQQGIEQAKKTRIETREREAKEKDAAWKQYRKENNISDLDAAFKYNAWEINYENSKK